jgi:hypothetical protein
VGGTLRPVEQRRPQQTTEEEEQPHETVVVAPVRKAAQGRLDGEMQGKDEGRAARYVATVRPTQAATRYVPLGTRTVASDIKERGADEEGDVAVPTTATEGTRDATVAASRTATADDGAHEGMNVVTATEYEAQQPLKDLSPARRQAKKRRAARAARRAKDRVRLAKDAERAAVLAATTATLRQPKQRRRGPHWRPGARSRSPTGETSPSTMTRRPT